MSHRKMPFRFVLCPTVALLDVAGELVTVVSDDVEVIIGRFALLSLRLPVTCFQLRLNSLARLDAPLLNHCTAAHVAGPRTWAAHV
jgi:hypothetical protein